MEDTYMIELTHQQNRKFARLQDLGVVCQQKIDEAARTMREIEEINLSLFNDRVMVLSHLVEKNRKKIDCIRGYVSDDMIGSIEDDITEYKWKLDMATRDYVREAKLFRSRWES